MNINIRPEEEKDYRTVEEITRDAFWNFFVPGACEHFLLHNLRKSSSFIPELDLVATYEDKIIGHILYTLSEIKDETGKSHQVVTFGPLSVLPEFQNKGVGLALIKHSVKLASNMGYKAVVILGYPDYYKKSGFLNGKKFGISGPDGNFPKALMVLELSPGALNGIHGKFIESPDFAVDETELEKFDSTFSYKEKFETESQKKFAEMVNALED